MRDRVPTPRQSIIWDTNTAYASISVITDSQGFEGWGGVLSVASTVLYSPNLLPLYNLNMGNPTLSSLPELLSSNYTLTPDIPDTLTFLIPSRAGADPNPTAILISQITWDTNATSIISLAELPCLPNPPRTPPDQLHLYGPFAGSVPVGVPQTLTAAGFRANFRIAG